MHKPYFAGPFYLCLPINTQPKIITINLAALPQAHAAIAGRCRGDAAVFAEAAARHSARHERIVIKVGGGGRKFARSDSRSSPNASARVVVLSPNSPACCPTPIPSTCMSAAQGIDQRQLRHGGGELLIVVGRARSASPTAPASAIPRSREVININGDIDDADPLQSHDSPRRRHRRQSSAACWRRWARSDAPRRWREAGRMACRSAPRRRRSGRRCAISGAACRPMPSTRSGSGGVMTQPSGGRHGSSDFADGVGALKLFDAGDVQANGFQINADDDGPSTRSPNPARPTWALPPARCWRRRCRRARATDRLFRRRLVHDEPADPDRCGRASRARPCSSSSTTGAWPRSRRSQQAQYGHEFGTNDHVAGRLRRHGEFRSRA